MGGFGETRPGKGARPRVAVASFAKGAVAVSTPVGPGEPHRAVGGGGREAAGKVHFSWPPGYGRLDRHGVSHRSYGIRKESASCLVAADCLTAVLSLGLPCSGRSLGKPVSGIIADKIDKVVITSGRFPGAVGLGLGDGDGDMSQLGLLPDLGPQAGEDASLVGRAFPGNGTDDSGTIDDQV